jgi:hypothetical protein
MKKVIRLTEGDLHRIIKESVKKIISEATAGGEHFDGNNPEDWAAMAVLRKGMRGGDPTKIPHASAEERNLNNYYDGLKAKGLYKPEEFYMDKAYPGGEGNGRYFKGSEAEKALMAGKEKANRVMDRLGIDHSHPFYQHWK